MFTESKCLLDCIQDLNPMERFMAWVDEQDNSPYWILLPWRVHIDHITALLHLESTKFPQDTFLNYPWSLKLILTHNQRCGIIASKKCKSKQSQQSWLGPYLHVCYCYLSATILNILTLLDSMNIDICKSYLWISAKGLQYWEIHSKRMLCNIHTVYVMRTSIQRSYICSKKWRRSCANTAVWCPVMVWQTTSKVNVSLHITGKLYLPNN